MIKVLLVSADPQETRPLRLNQEFRQICNQFYSLDNQKFDVRIHPATTYDDLRKVLLSYKPSIVHFSCHGIGRQGLILVEDNEKKEIINTGTLADLFRICQEEESNIACVIFNACYGEFQAKEINKYVKYAIGMSNQIKDDYAICFAKVFYEALFLKKTIETAFELGRNSIRHAISKNRSNLPRAQYDPAPDDIVASLPIPDYEIPQLIVNEELKDVYDLNQGLVKQNKILSYEQWNTFYSILEEIKSQIIKNVLRETLIKDIKLQDVEAKIISLQTAQDLKKLYIKYQIFSGNR